METCCCCCSCQQSQRKAMNTMNKKHQSTYVEDDDVVEVRHYGCYRWGMIVSILAILILVIGTVPVYATTKNSKLILLVILITLILVTIMVFIFLTWQHKRARAQRQRFGRPYLSRPVEVHSDNDDIAPRHASERTSWLFWNTTKKPPMKPEMIDREKDHRMTVPMYTSV